MEDEIRKRKEKRKAYMKEYRERPYVKKRKKDYAARPSVRAKTQKYRKKYFEDPERREKQRLRSQAYRDKQKALKALEKEHKDNHGSIGD